MRLLPAVCAGLGLLLAGCSAAPAGSPSASAPAASEPVAIATTTHLGSLLGDITQCAGATSATLMGPGDDPHDFSVSSSQVAAMIKSGLVISSGLGLEGGLTSVLDGVQREGATVFEVAPRLDPLKFADIHTEREGERAEDEHGHDDHADDDHEHTGADDGHHHGEYDPHVHMDAARMATAATLIGAELATKTGDQAYIGCAEQVAGKVREADAEVRRILSAIPEQNRVLVTDHEAYNYFARAYGFTVAAVVIPGGSTDAEPSSAELASLVETIKHDHIKVIFSNNTVSPRMMEALARESGTEVKIVELFEGSVGPQGSGADTYTGMMITDAQRIADALK
ncbi:MAG: metal ABC transporter substrate-binding protein [Propioniciclava sp.]|uniref:metal ABC transporter solute-binding protein, Zn/Mn family n=1 Tax=Propioniciclava sp. TaxID=2038686 RepID=UPI0039E52256